MEKLQLGYWLYLLYGKFLFGYRDDSTGLECSYGKIQARLPRSVVEKPEISVIGQLAFSCQQIEMSTKEKMSRRDLENRENPVDWIQMKRPKRRNFSLSLSQLLLTNVTYPTRIKTPPRLTKKNKEIKKSHFTSQSERRKWLVRWTPDREIRVPTLAGVIVLCSCAKHFTLTVPLSTQEYKWVPANCQGFLTKCWEFTCDGLASHPGGVAILLVASC